MLKKTELYLCQGRHLRLREDAGSDAAVSRRRHYPPGRRKPRGPQHQGPVHLCPDQRNGYPKPAPGCQNLLGKPAGRL